MTNLPEFDTARVAVVAHLERAELYRDLGRWTDFEAALREARRIDPLGPSAILRAEWLARRSLLEEAATELEAVLAVGTVNQHPDRFLLAARNLAAVHQRSNRYDDADRVLQRAIEVAVAQDRFDAGLLTTLGVSKLHGGNLEAAGRMFEGALAIAETDEERAEALSRLGERHLAAGSRREAVACLWRAYRLHARLGIDVAIGRDLFHLAEVCWGEGHTRPAFRAWRKAALRFECCNADDWANRVWQRLDEAARALEEATTEE